MKVNPHIYVALFIIILSLIEPGMNYIGKAQSEPCQAVIDIKSDEEIMFFPSYAYKNRSGKLWMAGIHAWVYEPEKDSTKRQLLINIIAQSIGLSLTDDDKEKKKIFSERAHYFLVDQEGEKEVSVSVGDDVFTIGKTDRNGHAEKYIAVGDDTLMKYSIANNGMYRHLPFYAVSKSLPQRRYSGKVLLIKEKGISVVSDIDDTIKITDVNDKKAMLGNTFLKPFKAVYGMARLYRKLARRGAVFHYLSASPWQLYIPLSDFLSDESFPEGVFHMKYFGLSSNFSSLFSSSEDVKIPCLRELISRFPQRDFILIGDSGEKDPEIYGNIARQYPERIAGIYIRNVSGETLDREWYKDAFRGIPENKWHLFSTANQLEKMIGQ